MITRSASTGTALAAAFFAIVVLVRTTLPLLDGDVWWHLRAGETVLREGAVPTMDSWTVVGAGLPWISQDWMSNVLMAWLFGADERWGATLLSLAFGVIAVAAFLVLWGAIGRRRPSASTLGRVVLLSAGLIVAAPVLGVRVQTVDLLMIALTIGLLWGYLSDRGVRWLIGLPVLALVWANMHAGWPLLFALGGAVIMGEALDRSLGRRVDSEPLAWGQIAALAGSLATCAPALILNPNGTRLLNYPFATASIQAHRDFLFEWSPPDVSTFPGQALIVFLVAVVLPTLVLGHRHLRSAEMLWLGGLSILSLSAIRFVIAIGPVGAAIAAVALLPALADRGWLSGNLAAIFDRPPRTRRLAIINLGLAVLMVLMGMGVATARVSPSAQESAIAEAMPVEATAFLAAERPSARIFNVYSWGGYIGRELPDAVVYIDGRSDVFGDAPIREYAEAIALERDPFEILDRRAINIVLFWPDTAFSEALDHHPSWRRIYDGSRAAVWVRERGG